MPTDDLDSGQAGGQVSQPGGTTSQSGDKPTSNNAEMPEWAKNLIKRVEDAERFSKRAQGADDKLLSEIGRISPLLEKVQKYAGLNDEQIAQLQEKMEMDEIKRIVLGGQQNIQNQPAPVGNGTGTGTDNQAVEKAIRKYGLDVNDAEVVQALRDNDDQYDKVAALAALSVRRQSEPQPNLAANAASAGGQSILPQTRDKLKAAYTTEMLTARGNRSVIKAIQAKYKAQGLDVENIGFNVG